MKTKVLLMSAICISLFISSCKKKDVADETITYEVTLSNPSRTAYMEFGNETGGKDAANANTSSFTKSYTVKSNASKQTYALSLSCYAKYVSGSTTQFQNQSITVNIKEDDKVIKTITKSGSSDLYIYSSEISASLPTATKYK